MGEAGGLPLTNDLGWMLVRLHDFTQRIGVQDSYSAVVEAAAGAFGEFVSGTGAAYYSLGPDGLRLVAGKTLAGPAFPPSLTIVSQLGGVLTQSSHPAAPTLPLGESVDGDGNGAILSILRTKDGADIQGVLWIRRSDATDLPDPVRAVLSVLVDYVGITIHMVRLLEAERLRAAIDDLTGLLGRAAFLREAAREVARSRRTSEPFSVLMLDADHFKAVNDVHGHAGGDAVLVSLARTLVEVTRETDVVGRLGGEEFGVLLPNADTAGARVVAERVRAAVEANPIAFRDATIPLTLSIGVACWTNDEGIDALFSRADAAMYSAKAGGRNQVAEAS